MIPAKGESVNIYVLKRFVIVFRGETFHLSPLFFKNRDNAEKAIDEWNAKMKSADYIDGFGGYVETAELEDA